MLKRKEGSDYKIVRWENQGSVVNHAYDDAHVQGILQQENVQEKIKSKINDNREGPIFEIGSFLGKGKLVLARNQRH